MFFKDKLFWGKISNSLLITLIFIGIFFRFWNVETIPGINGDEIFGSVGPILRLRGIYTMNFTSSGITVWTPEVLFRLIHIVLPPSILLIRLTAAFVGTLTVALAYFLYKKALGKNKALILACLISTVPLLIADSRMLWAPSFTPLFSVIAIAAALYRRYIIMIFFLIISIWTYPTGIFIAPFLVGACLYKLFLNDSGKKVRTIIFFTISIGLFGVLLHYLLKHNDFNFNYLNIYKTAIDRMFLWKPLYSLWHFLLSLFIGVQSYFYIMGSIPIWPSISWHQGAFYILVLLAALGFINKKNILSRLLLLFGLLLSIYIFFLAAGSISHGFQRHGLWVSIPLCIWLAIMLKDNLINKAFVILVSCFFLFSFYWNYLHAFIIYNSPSGPYTSGYPEPNEAAFEIIDENRDLSKQTIIFTDSWWLYWPIKYLTLNKDNYYTTIYGHGGSAQLPGDFIIPPEIQKTGEKFIFCFSDWALCNESDNKEKGFELLSKINGYGDKEIFRIFHQTKDNKQEKNESVNAS